MKKILAVLIAFLLAAASASAQLPRVGSIDFYGLRSLKPADLAGALAVQIGDSLTTAPELLRQRLLGVPGVADAAVSTICCEAGRTMLYVGIQERGAPALTFAPAPTGEARLPPSVMKWSSEYYRSLMEGIQRGQAGEDHTGGHAIASYAPVRALQEQFIAYAENNLDTLRAVLRGSSDAEHRALAALIIAYTPHKTAVIPDLVTAMRDVNEHVRNNAMRALAVMAMYAESNPGTGLAVPHDAFIELLNSLEWTDRNKASFALAALTTGRNPALLMALGKRAFDSLVDIARWRAFGHAAAAGVILGRIAGLSEDEVIPAFQKNREGVIAAARAAIRAPASRP